MVDGSIWGAEVAGLSPVSPTMPYDTASVHVVALLSSIVLGITQNCPLGYSAVAKR